MVLILPEGYIKSKKRLKNIEFVTFTPNIKPNVLNF